MGKVKCWGKKTRKRFSLQVAFIFLAHLITSYLMEVEFEEAVLSNF